MKQHLDINNQKIDFNFIDGANCWRTNTTINGLEIEIEIDLYFHKENEVDWNHFERFFKFISKDNVLQKLILDSENLANELGKAFYRECANEVLDWRMGFTNSILYKGRTDGTFIKDGCSYSLIYHFSVTKGNQVDGDPYGIYLIDIENFIIVGARRHQC